MYFGGVFSLDAGGLGFGGLVGTLVDLGADLVELVIDFSGVVVELERVAVLNLAGWFNTMTWAMNIWCPWRVQSWSLSRRSLS